MHAVVLAGGRGTRLAPLTDTRPKPLLPFLAEPFAVGLLRRLGEVGVADATFLVGQDATPWRALEDAARGLGLALDVRTEEVPLDTAGAARRRFAEGLDGPVLVCNGDICTDLDLSALLAAHRGAGATATLALTRVEDTSAFGVVVCDAGGRVQRFVEKPAPGTEAADTVNAGTYVLAADAFAAFPGDGPLSFERAVFPGLLSSGALVVGVASEAYWQDLGTPRRYLDGHRDVLAGRCRWPIAPDVGVRAGGIALAPGAQVAAGAAVGPDVVVGPGAVIAEGAQVRDSVLHEGAQVLSGARVTGSVIGAGATVRPGAVVTDVVVAPGATAGDAAGEAEPPAVTR